MADIYHRPDLARELAERLLRPGPLDVGLRSGLFLAGQRRTGKTTFLRQDFIPALENLGAVVVYVDLWTDLTTDPSKLVVDAVRRALHDMESPASGLARRLHAVRNVNLDVFGVKFEFDVEKVGTAEGATLAEAFSAAVRRSGTDVVLIVDEVQHALSSETGQRMLFELKAARDAVNKTPDMPGHFLFVGTGSHRAKVAELTARRQQAFDGAVSANYPVLGRDYVAHVLDDIRPHAIAAGKDLPDTEATFQAFEQLGHRPEELIKALRALLIQGPPAEEMNRTLEIIASALRSAAADLDLERVAGLGRLAAAIFDKIATAGDSTKGIFTSAAAEQYSTLVGREVKIEEIQPVVLALQDANLIMRQQHGVYSVADPFVQKAWLERREMEMLGAMPGDRSPDARS